jgi:hypothetical protein
MTEQVFIDLGFERNDMSPEQSGQATPFHYYTLDIGDICFISNASDQAEEKGWECSIFDSMTLKVKGAGDLEELVKIVKLNTYE